MNAKQYFQASGLIFTVICLVHAARVVQGWALSIGTWDAPMTLSYVAIVLAGFLAYSAWKLGS